jgi:hypothetical protein
MTTSSASYTPVCGIRQPLNRVDPVELNVEADELWTPAYRASGFEVHVTPTAQVRAPGRRVTRFNFGGHPKIRCGGIELFLDNLVATAYLPRRQYGWELRHVDKDWENCHADNLCWYLDPDVYEDELRRQMLPSPPCRCPVNRQCGCRPYYVRPQRHHDDAVDYGNGSAKVPMRCRRGHDLTPENVTLWGYGNRICLTCHPQLAS